MFYFIVIGLLSLLPSMGLSHSQKKLYLSKISYLDFRNKKTYQVKTQNNENNAKPNKK